MNTARFAAWWEAYWYEPMERTRLRYFARIIYVGVLVNIWLVDDWAPPHAWAPRAFWQPMWIARVLSVPAPTPTTMAILQTVLTVSALAAIALARPTDSIVGRRLARAVNTVVFLGFGLWGIWAFSWSKVDHDKLTMLVALAALAVVPGVGSGRDRGVGWALRTVQVVFVLAYPLSAIAKIQKSGWLWANQATFARAIIRRGTSLGSGLAQHGQLLRIGQWGFIGFELVSVLALFRNPKVRAVILPGFFFLHFFTWLAIGIHFFPHTICLTAFLPLERLDRLRRRSPEVAAAGAAT